MEGNPSKCFLLLTSLHWYPQAVTMRGFETNLKCNFTLLDG